jgi:hypothetical protein
MNNKIMPNLTPYFYSFTNNVKTKNYIETGTYLGEGIKCVLNKYETIHSIELSEKWYQYNVENFKSNSSVKMYLGDSKKILPVLLNDLNEPVTIYLDAHYSGGSTAFGEEETPLLLELDVLKNRKFDDIIIIDDCRLLGKTGTCGISDHDVIYPTMKYDWSNVTENNIVNMMKEGYILLKNDNGVYTDGPHDQYILVKKH